MQNYNELCKKIILTGTQDIDRTGVGTVSLFGEQLRFNLQDGFPAVTTKRLAWKSVVSELLWFIEGSGDERRLAEILHGTRDESKQTIWTANANSGYWLPKSRYAGDLGRVYGVQWRHWRYVDENTPLFKSGALVRNYDEVDQLKELIDGLISNPTGRRHIITAWNPGELKEMALPPCHVMCQFNVHDGNKLSCSMYQRSCDLFLGIPFNIASYSVLTHLLAKHCGLEAYEFIHFMGNCHLYENAIDAAKLQIQREPYPFPTITIKQVRENIDDYQVEDFEVHNYINYNAIKVDMVA